MKRYIDKKLLYYLMAVTGAGVASSSLGIVGVVFTILFALFVNMAIYNGQLVTLFFTFLFLDNFSIIWGGSWGPIPFSVLTVDIQLTQASNFLGIILVVMAIFKGYRLPKFNGLDYWVTIFFLLGMLSPLITVDPKEPTEMAFRFVQFYVLYLVIRIVLRSEADLTRYFKYIVTSFIPVFVVVFIQFITGYFGQGDGHPQIVMDFIPYLLALSSLTGVSTTVIWPLIIFSSFVSTFSGSRRIILSLLGYFILHYQRKRGVLGAIFIMVTIYGAFSVFKNVLPDTILERVDSTSADLEYMNEQGTDEHTLDNLTTGRAGFWATTYLIFLDYPIFGIGTTNQAKFMKQYGGGLDVRAHNYYMEVLADLGLTGFITLLMIVVMSFLLLARVLKNLSVGSQFEINMIHAYKIQLILIHAIAFLGSSMLYKKWAWASYAIIASMYTVYVQNKKAVEAPATQNSLEEAAV